MLVGMGVLAQVICAGVMLRHPHVAAVGFGEHFIVCAPRYTDEYFDAMYVNLATRFFPFVLGVAVAWLVVDHEARVRAWLDAHPRRRDALFDRGLRDLRRADRDTGIRPARDVAVRGAVGVRGASGRRGASVQRWGSSR